VTQRKTPAPSDHFRAEPPEPRRPGEQIRLKHHHAVVRVGGRVMVYSLAYEPVRFQIWLLLPGET